MSITEEFVFSLLPGVYNGSRRITIGSIKLEILLDDHADPCVVNVFYRRNSSRRLIWCELTFPDVCFVIKTIFTHYALNIVRINERRASIV